MKLTPAQLRRIIKEEVLKEMEGFDSYVGAAAIADTSPRGMAKAIANEIRAGKHPVTGESLELTGTTADKYIQAVGKALSSSSLLPGQ